MTTTDTTGRAKQIRDRLAEIAPYPAWGTAITAKSVATYLAVCAQLGWTRNITPFIRSDQEIPFPQIAAQFAAAHALLALTSSIPPEQAAREIVLAWNGGGAAGIWLWEHLAALGVDADEVTRLEQERMALDGEDDQVARLKAEIARLKNGAPGAITEQQIVTEMAAAESTKAVPSRWRRGTAEVEAMQLTHESGPQVWEWADSKPTYGTDKFVDGLAVYTRAGRVRASFGDWIVRDARGAFTVWLDETFREHHQPADEALSAPVSDPAPSRTPQDSPARHAQPRRDSGPVPDSWVTAFLAALNEQARKDRPVTWTMPGTEEARALLAVAAQWLEQENAAAYGISCADCAARLDRANTERERAEKAEAKLAAVRERAETWAGLAARDFAAAGRAILAITGTEGEK